MRRRLSLAAAVLVACALAGCGSDEAGKGGAASTTTASAAAHDQFGAYPADPSLDARGVVKAYVEALDRRDGARFCSVVAAWISRRFDIGGTDPDAALSRPLRCPGVVAAFIGYIEDCCPPEFLGARVSHVGTLERRGDVVGVPITVTLRLKTRTTAAARIQRLSRTSSG